MIRLYLFALAAAVVGLAAASWLRADVGYVLVSYRQWIVETSILGLVAAGVAGLLLLYLAARLLLLAVRLPTTLREVAQRRRGDRAQESFEAGLLKLLEGNWRRAEIELVRRAADHHAAHLNYLGAARAAQRVGAGDRRDHYLRLAARSAPELEFATLLTQAELQRERGEYALARDTALALRNREPMHPYAIELLAECYAALRAWEALRALLPEAEKASALTPSRVRELMIRAMTEMMRAAVDEARLDRLKSIWDCAPARFRDELEVRRAYARGLARLNADAEALALITGTLAKNWDGEMVLLYGELHAVDPLAQLATIEQWLNQYGEKHELLVTAGRACLRNKLWGKARSYLEAVLRVAPSPAAYLELAHLCEQTQNTVEANRWYQQGLEMAAQSA
ncbi:MAG TPA: heme biosynthesis HemY N-terminal domain-containing protein [Nevskiaceae bacterium]|nr:heme biosynthesis HemY N-terminal domain-containing protein [Nevskiaceae bacterium]